MGDQMDWVIIYRDIEDKLLPHYQCDIWERGLYYYLIGQSRLREREQIIVPLPQIAAGLKCSEFQARKVIRSLSQKGIILLEQTRQGHQVRVLLPSELSIPEAVKDQEIQDIETIDFYQGRRYLRQILDRERWSCFYCLKEITEETCQLDHLLPQVSGGTNNYRNIVASCYNCNTRKQGFEATDFLRSLFRSGFLSETEIGERMTALEQLQSGLLKPVL